MKTVVRLIVRLYPPAMRESYGRELEETALFQMHDGRPGRRLWIALGLIVNAFAAWLDTAHSILGALIGAGTAREGLKADVKAALRGVWSAPFYASTVVATLAIGVGVNAAVFSVVDGVVLSSLPYEHAERLVRVHGIDPRNGDRHRPLTPGHLNVVRSASGVEGAVGIAVATRPLIAGSAARDVEVARAAGDIVSVMGLKIALGRAPTRGEWEKGEPVVLLSHRLWRSMFGEDASVIGSAISVGNRPYTVVGILSEGSVYPPGVELVRAMTADERADGDPDLAVLARLSHDANRGRVEEEIRLRTRSYLAAGAPELPGLDVRVEDARSTIVQDIQAPLFLVQAAALAILLVTCLNLAHLLLVRGELRRGDLAIRTAIGAHRTHLVRLMLLEGLGLVVMGAVAGVLAGRAALPLLLALVPAGTPRLENVVMDFRVLTWMLGLTGATFLAFAVGPAVRVSAVPPSMAFATRGVVGRPKHHWASRGLVIGEVALSTVLVITAVLLAMSFARLATLDRGYDATRLLYVPVTPAAGSVNAHGGRSGYEDILLDEVRALPGVEAAALATHPPTSLRAINFGLFSLEELSVARDDWAPRGGVAAVSADYFRTVGLKVLEGRAFIDTDVAQSEPVAVASRAFARTFLHRGEGAMLRMRVGGSEKTKDVRIVGVVEDTRPVAGEPAPELLYVPLSQVRFGANLIARIAGDPGVAAASLRSALQRFDARLPTNRMLHLAHGEQVDAASFQAWIVGLFASLALLVAVIGVYGVTAYAVERRIPEFGVRRALGATGTSLRRLVLGSAATLAGVGVALGMAGAFAISGLLSGLLFEVSPMHPGALVGVASGLGFVAILAAWVPAARASRVPPARALRGE